MWQLEEKYKERKQNLIDNGFDAYCLFTLSGNEVKLAKEYNKKFDDILALPLIRMAHQSKDGYKSEIQKVMLPGYTFLFVPKNYSDEEFLTIGQFPFRVLGKDVDFGKLVGEDYEYAKWIIEIDGIIGISQAIKLYGKVKIISGPLKNLEGNIVEYSRRNRNCRVEIEFINQKIDMWLPFNWVDVE